MKSHTHTFTKPKLFSIRVTGTNGKGFSCP